MLRSFLKSITSGVILLVSCLIVLHYVDITKDSPTYISKVVVIVSIIGAVLSMIIYRILDKNIK